MPEEDEVFQDWETKHTYFHVLFCGWKMKDLQCNIAYFSGYLMESSHDVLIQVPNSQVIFASWKRPPWLLWSGTLTRRNLTKRCHWWRRYSWTHGSCYTPKDTHGCKAYKAKPGNPLVVRTGWKQPSVMSESLSHKHWICMFQELYFYACECLPVGKCLEGLHKFDKLFVHLASQHHQPLKSPAIWMMSYPNSPGGLQKARESRGKSLHVFFCPPCGVRVLSDCSKNWALTQH